MTEMLDPITRQHVEKAAEALQDEFSGTSSRETIARFIAESVDLLGGSKISAFVPVLAHRFARERLKALGQAEGLITKDQPEVLFVCVHNAGRSQMAAGLLTLRSGGLVGVRSAGSEPGEIVNPLVAEAMTELGVDLADAFPEAAHRRGRARRRRRHHDGLRRCCPIYRASATRTGRWTTRRSIVARGRAAAFATTSTRAFDGCSPSSAYRRSVGRPGVAYSAAADSR